MLNLLRRRKAPGASGGEAAVALDVGVSGVSLDDSQLETITAGNDFLMASENDNEDPPVLTFAG